MFADSTELATHAPPGTLKRQPPAGPVYRDLAIDTLRQEVVSRGERNREPIAAFGTYGSPAREQFRFVGRLSVCPNPNEGLGRKPAAEFDAVPEPRREGEVGVIDDGVGRAGCDIETVQKVELHDTAVRDPGTAHVRAPVQERLGVQRRGNEDEQSQPSALH